LINGYKVLISEININEKMKKLQTNHKVVLAS